MLALLGTCVFWGLSFPLSKGVALVHATLVPEASGWLVTASTIWPRFLLAAAILAVVAHRRLRGITRLEVWQGVGLGVFMSGGICLQVDGLQHTEASTSAFLSQCYVVLLPLVVYGRQRRLPSLRLVLGTVMVMAGVVILADVDWRAMRMGRGELETLLSTLFFTGQILWLDRPVFAVNRVTPVTLIMFLVVGGVFLGAAAIMADGGGALLAPWASMPWIVLTLLLAVPCSVLALMLMNTWQPKLSATEAGLIYATEPVWASLLVLFVPGWMSTFAGVVYPNEALTWHLVAGGTLITAANVLIQLAPPKEQPEVVRGEVL